MSLPKTGVIDEQLWWLSLGMPSQTQQRKQSVVVISTCTKVEPENLHHRHQFIGTYPPSLALELQSFLCIIHSSSDILH